MTYAPLISASCGRTTSPETKFPNRLVSSSIAFLIITGSFKGACIVRVMKLRKEQGGMLKFYNYVFKGVHSE